MLFTSCHLQKKVSRAAPWFILLSMLSKSNSLQKKASRAVPWLIACLCYLWAALWFSLLSMMSTPGQLSPEESVQTCATIYSLYCAIFVQLCPETKAPWASLWYLHPALSRRKLPEVHFDLHLAQSRTVPWFILLSTSSSLQKGKKMAKAGTSSTSGSIRSKNVFRPVPGFIPLSMLSTSSSVQESTARAISFFSFVLIICVWLPMKKAVRTMPGFILSGLSMCDFLKKGAKAEPWCVVCDTCIWLSPEESGQSYTPWFNHLFMLSTFKLPLKKVARAMNHDLTTSLCYLHLNYPRTKWPELYTVM